MQKSTVPTCSALNPAPPTRPLKSPPGCDRPWAALGKNCCVAFEFAHELAARGRLPAYQRRSIRSSHHTILDDRRKGGSPKSSDGVAGIGVRTWKPRSRRRSAPASPARANCRRPLQNSNASEVNSVPLHFKSLRSCFIRTTTNPGHANRFHLHHCSLKILPGSRSN